MPPSGPSIHVLEYTRKTPACASNITFIASDSERGLLGGVGLSWTNFGVLINCILALVLLISGKRKAELGETTVTEVSYAARLDASGHPF